MKFGKNREESDVETVEQVQPVRTKTVTLSINIENVPENTDEAELEAHVIQLIREGFAQEAAAQQYYEEQSGGSSERYNPFKNRKVDRKERVPISQRIKFWMQEKGPMAIAGYVLIAAAVIALLICQKTGVNPFSLLARLFQ